MDPNDNSAHLPEPNKIFHVPSDDTQADLDLQNNKDQALQDSYSSEADIEPTE